jgi:hypothetical protein
MDKKIIITQSNYIPWKGYFDNLKQSNVFVIYDDMQYTRRDWRNRNYIKTANGLKWLTIPVEVKGKYYQKINETKIAKNTWSEDHLNLIKENYNKAAYYLDMFSWIEELYKKSGEMNYLTDVNTYLLQEICKFLNIKTEFVDSRKLEIKEDKTGRLVHICKQLNGTEYLTGPAAKNYLEPLEFEKENIRLTYFNYEGYPEYPQLYPPFQHGVSILDLILNCGSESEKKIIKE